MSAVQPYPAMFFFAADDNTEVTREFEKFMEGAPTIAPDLTQVVQVIAVEYIIGHGDYVWFIREGEVFRRESWMVRAL